MEIMKNTCDYIKLYSLINYKNLNIFSIFSILTILKEIIKTAFDGGCENYFFWFQLNEKKKINM